MPNEITALLTRGQVADAVADFIQDTGTNRRIMILRDLDRGYRMALRRFAWPQSLRWLDTAVQMAASSAYFFLPKDVQQLIRVMNSSVPAVLDEYTSQDVIDRTYGFTNITGIPYQFAQIGDSAISTTFTAATALQIASDGTDVRTGVIEGLLANQNKRSTFTLNGTTPVALGSWDEVTQLYLSASSAARTVTMTKVSDATTVSLILSNETRSTYKRYRLWPIPSQATALRVVYKFSPPAILDESHEYIIPIQDYLFDYATAKSFESRRQFAPATQHLQEAEAALLSVWQESRGSRTEMYIPSSPYLNFQAQFYTPVLGGF